jgi:hypothetical protein
MEAICNDSSELRWIHPCKPWGSSVVSSSDQSLMYASAHWCSMSEFPNCPWHLIHDLWIGSFLCKRFSRLSGTQRRTSMGKGNDTLRSKPARTRGAKRGSRSASACGTTARQTQAAAPGVQRGAKESARQTAVRESGTGEKRDTRRVAKLQMDGWMDGGYVHRSP